MLYTVFIIPVTSLPSALYHWSCASFESRFAKSPKNTWSVMLSTYASFGSALISFAGTSVLISSITSTSSEMFTRSKSLSNPLFPRPSFFVMFATWSRIEFSAPFTALTMSAIVALSNPLSFHSVIVLIVISSTLSTIIGSSLPFIAHASFSSLSALNTTLTISPSLASSKYPRTYFALFSSSNKPFTNVTTSVAQSFSNVLFSVITVSFAASKYCPNVLSANTNSTNALNFSSSSIASITS